MAGAAKNVAKKILRTTMIRVMWHRTVLNSLAFRRCVILVVRLKILRVLKLALCRLCKVAKYCSKECQKDDWEKNHKKACKAYRNNP
jgi:hypothetical protein